MLQEYSHAMYLLGYTKASLEWLARFLLAKEADDEIVGFLTEFDEDFTRELQNIFKD